MLRFKSAWTTSSQGARAAKNGDKEDGKKFKVMKTWNKSKRRHRNPKAAPRARIGGTNAHAWPAFVSLRPQTRSSACGSRTRTTRTRSTTRLGCRLCSRLRLSRRPRWGCT
jgi:hypothetical protein